MKTRPIEPGLRSSPGTLASQVRPFSGLVLLLLILILAACERLPELPFLTDRASATATGEVGIATPAAMSTSTAGSSTPEGPQDQPSNVNLKIWVPPQFDPAAATPAGELLKARLEEFQAAHSHVRIEVRLKAVTGPGGLLDVLTTASAAAPLAVPDLVALPQFLLESTALDGLIYPYDGLTTAMEDHEWYGYARELGQVQTSTFGLPFAGDALMVAYRPLLVETPPHNWESTLAISGTLAFPAADPQGLFTLIQYLAAGGAVQDEQGHVILEEKPLVDVLSFYQTAERAGVMPFWLTQFENFDQVWESFGGRQTSIAASWLSSYLNRYEDLSIHPQIAVLPTPSGKAYTLATGWVWAIASSGPDRRELSAQLAEFLLEDSFLGKWTFAAGYLPPHRGALGDWQDADLRALLDQVQSSAHLFPPTEVLDRLGPLLEQATVDVLKEQSDPLNAAKTALEGLNSP